MAQFCYYCKSEELDIVYGDGYVRQVCCECGYILEEEEYPPTSEDDQDGGEDE